MHDEVALKPLPPCLLPSSVLQGMRAIPSGTLSLIRRLVDYAGRLVRLLLDLFGSTMSYWKMRRKGFVKTVVVNDN